MERDDHVTPPVDVIDVIDVVDDVFEVMDVSAVPRPLSPVCDVMSPIKRTRTTAFETVFQPVSEVVQGVRTSGRHKSPARNIQPMFEPALAQPLPIQQPVPGPSTPQDKDLRGGRPCPGRTRGRGKKSMPMLDYSSPALVWSNTGESSLRFFAGPM